MISMIRPGRGDITTQAVLMRNARARGRFVAGEKMVVAGLEAAEEVFITLDPQQQIEAFVADGEEVDAGKVIARTSGFADVLLAGERVALNLLQHLSGIATTTRQFVRAIEGTNAKIADTRKTTPGLRMLEKYAVLLGGGAKNVLQRVASWGDGWLPNRVTPDQLRESRATLDRLAKENGRDPAAITISVHGQPADRDLVRRLLDAGATRVIIRPATSKSEPEMVRELTRIAETVMR